MGSCCSRFCADWRYSFFAVEEKPNYGTVDLDKSFCMNDSCTWYAILIKLAILLWAAGSFIYELVSNPNPYFRMSFLTNWTVTFQLVYLALSLLCSISSIDWIMKGAWLMYPLSVVNGFIVFLLFWLTEFDPVNFDLDYWQICAHGGIFLATFLEGFVINRIPIRNKHMFWVMLWGFLFIAWTLIFTVTGIDNPYKGDDESQSLYKILDWETKPALAAGVAAGVVLVAIPVLHILFWTLLLCRRAYVTEGKDESNVEMEQSNVEMEQMEGGTSSNYVRSKQIDNYSSDEDEMFA